MRIIHFLGNYRNCFTRHYHPVRLFKQALLQEGIKTHFFTSPVSPGIKNCDVLAFFADGFREILPVKSKNDNTVFGYLGDFFNQFSWVVWFDDNDSSGLLEPNAFSLVDVYVKAQILKDTGYYLEDHLIGALHRDYAHQQFGVEDRKLFKGRITKQDLGKLRLGWNLSLVNWNYYNAKSKAEKLWFFLNPGKYHLQSDYIDLTSRSKQVMFRGRMWQREPTVGWWREKTLAHVKSHNSRYFDNPPDLGNTVSRQQYREELRNSIVSPSPFGKGEICYRDFESYMTGALLLKPEMNHMETWPNLYIDGKTYISHKWDFSDFEEKLEKVLSHPERYEEIAREGQKRFESALVESEGFADHFKAILS